VADDCLLGAVSCKFVPAWHADAIAFYAPGVWHAVDTVGGIWAGALFASISTLSHPDATVLSSPAVITGTEHARASVECCVSYAVRAVISSWAGTSVFTYVVT